METNVLSNANNFHCPAIQYGCRAKPLYKATNSLSLQLCENECFVLKFRPDLLTIFLIRGDLKPWRSNDRYHKLESKFCLSKSVNKISTRSTWLRYKIQV